MTEEMEASEKPPSSSGNGMDGEKNTKGLVVIMVGAPGSGKSTFCQQVIGLSTRPWLRVCQDTIANGKGGKKAQCLMSAASALKEGKSVFIDRCNFIREQRDDFVKLGSPQVDVHAVVLDLPAKLCISRCAKRTGHEGNLQGGRAAAVINSMLQNKELPKLGEGYCRITFCQNEIDVQAAISAYGKLGPLDTLPSGSFGQKNPDSKVQLGIMKFLKKIDTPVDIKLKGQNARDNVSSGSTKEKHSSNTSLETVPTMAFASLSTSDFQFDLEKASDIIVEKVEEFLPKLGNARLVLVDLSSKSKILSLVSAKAGQRTINSDKFFTFVGDITHLYTCGSLRCNVIANAANWRLKPGGGGVNAAIFSAAGSDLETATKELAGSINPGRALVVPLPSTSPLCIKEGVTHVIHVLGPNMNPHRPNFLNNDYIKGCKILREAYSSLFEGFLSVLRSQEMNPLKREPETDPEKTHIGRISSTNLKVKRQSECESDKIKRCRGSKETSENIKISKSASKSWGSWAQALYQIAMDPENFRNDVVEITDQIVVLNDLYPKAKRHLLVLARCEGLDRLADVREEHLELLRMMHAVGMRWAEKSISEDETLVFRLGYHSAPSMRQFHLHVISQDFDSKHLKHKKHWNSFNTPFFRDSLDVIDEVNNHGQTTLKDDEESILSMELRCQRCRSVHPNMPRLKSHILNCRAPFPSHLLQNGRLVLSSNENSSTQ